MNRIRRISGAMALSLLTLGMADAASKVPVVVEGTPQLAPARYLLMVGTGLVRAAPDTAVISGGITTRARHAGDALHANSQAMAAIVTALKALGITDSEITTSSFNFQPQYDADSKGNVYPEMRIVAYTVTNMVSVTLTAKLERAGVVLDALIENGANQSTSIGFQIRDREALEMRAREEAGKNALQRAQIYTKAIGTELGPVRSVREGYYSDAGDTMESVTVTSARAYAPAPPPPSRVMAGEQEIAATVTVVWALK